MDHGNGEATEERSETRAAQLIGESHAELCLARERIRREASAAAAGDLGHATRALLEWVDVASALLGRLAIEARERITAAPTRRVGRPRLRK